AGAPNAGKSSLLNVLAEEDAAIVSSIPGTTRDVVRARIDIDGLPLHVLDTAGLRAAGDAIEREGMARTRAAMERADRVLLVIDDSVPSAEELATLREQVPVSAGCTVIRNKIDLSGRAPGVEEGEPDIAVAVSAKTRDG